MPAASSAFRTRVFTFYVLANFVSQLGTWIQRVAIGWLSWDLTHSTTSVGAISLLLFLPTLLLGAPFGAVSDRIDIKVASIAFNLAMTFVAAAFCIVQFFGVMTFPLLALLSVAQGLSSAAYQPIRLSIIPELVPRPQLASAIAANSFAFNLSRLIGPALSGLFIASDGLFLAFAANAVSALPLLAVVFSLRIADRPAHAAGKQFSIIADIAEAVRFLGANSRLSQQLAITALTSALGRGPMEMLPALAARTFDRGPVGLAWLMSSIGAGAMVAGLVLTLARAASLHSLRSASLYAVAIGFLTSLLAWISEANAILAIMFCLGLTTTFSSIISQTALQSEVSPELRGRIASIWVMISLGSPAVAGLLLGWLADFWGLHLMFGLAGGGCLFCALALGRRASG